MVAQPALAGYQPPHTRPGPAADSIAFKGGIPVDVAPDVIGSKGVDMYFGSLNTQGAQALRGRSEVRLVQVPAGSISIILNPAPAPAGQLNPFSITEVRFALQYVVNRDFVVNDIYKGLAAPMITQVSPFDYDYLGVSDTVRAANVRYDPDYANKLVTDAMTKANATLQNGQWIYNGNPITLKFIVRVEDERKDIGDLLSAELRKLGFVVNPVYQEFGPAIASVYGTDPAAFDWNLYTEGWRRGSAERYDSAGVNQFCAPWLGNLPGWKEVGFWQYENATLDEIGQRIFTGNFSSADQRNSLYRQATQICLQESVRLWVVTTVNTFPVSNSVQGLTLDSVGGPVSVATLREAYVAGRSNLTVGNIWVWTARTIWNPVGGFGDVYSLDIWRNLFDPPTWRNPFTGLPSPFRASYSVQTGGPTGKLQVPSDSVLWDAHSGAWKSVGSGVLATSKVVFNYKNYLSSKWHDGRPITMADIFYGIYQTFDITYNPNKSKIEFAMATVDKPFLDTFKGFRILNDTSLEVYVNYWHFVPDYIAEYASLAGVSTPWEILAAMDNLVFEQRVLAYSDTASAKFSVDWLSLVEPKHALLVKTTLGNLAEKSFFPQNVFTVGGRTLATPDDAQSRYKAAMSWYDQYGHMIISNGPFYLKTFDATSQFAEIDAFRDQSYPFKPGDWYFGEPPTIQITGIRGDTINIGSDSQFTVSVQGPGHLSLSYALFDPSRGTTIQRGQGESTGNGTFAVDLPSSVTSKVSPGSYQLFVIASSDSISVVTERSRLLQASTGGSTGTSATSVTTSCCSGTTTTSSVPPPGSDITLLAAGGVVAVIAVLLGFLLVRRRRMP